MVLREGIVKGVYLSVVDRWEIMVLFPSCCSVYCGEKIM